MNLLKLSLASLMFLATSQSFADSDDDGSLVLSLVGVAAEKPGESDYNYGLGALIEANINDHFGIETGALFIKRSSEISALGVTATQSVSQLHVPVLARFWATDYLSLGVGPFVEFKTGDVNTEFEAGDSSIDFDSSADDSAKFGLDAAATVNLAVADKTGIFAEARYSMYFDEEDDEELNRMMYLVGLKLDL